MAYDGGANPLTQPLLEPGSADDAATGDVPVTPKPMGDPESGPAYDSITSSDSNFNQRDVSLSHVQPGQAIALPDGSVIPVGGGETTDYRSNMATGSSQPPYPPAPVQYSHTSTGAGPVRGPFPGGYYVQQQPPLPSKTGATPGPAPGGIASPYVQSASSLPYKPGATPGPAPSQAYIYPQQGLPSKPGATPGPAPSQAYRQQGLPSKHGATPGPAPGMTYPQQLHPGATPGPPPHAKGSEGSGPAPQYTGPQMQHQYPHAMASNDRQSQYRYPSGYNYNQQQHYRYPPPQPPYQQPYQARGPAQPLAPFSPTQYQPYRGPPPVQVLGQGGAVPYYPYQGAITNQPKPRPPVKTSFKFNAKTVDDNHFYVAICLLVTVIVCVNPLGLLCTIPALIFGYIAASANAKDNYEKALKYHKRARSCNIGTGAAIIGAGTYSVVIALYVGFFVSVSGGG